MDLMQIQMRNYDLEVAADEFIGDATEELTDELEDGNSSACNVRLLGVGHMNLDLNTINGSLEYNSALRKTPNESCHTLTVKYSHSQQHQAQGRQNRTHSNAGECSSMSLTACCLIALTIIMKSINTFYLLHKNLKVINLIF